MKEQLKKGFSWLRPAIVRLIVSIIYGVVTAIVHTFKVFATAPIEKNITNDEAEIMFLSQIFINATLILIILYVFIVWLYSDTKKETL